MLRIIQAGQVVQLDSIRAGEQTFLRIANDSGDTVDVIVSTEDLQKIIRLAIHEREVTAQKSSNEDPGTFPEPETENFSFWNEEDDDFSPFSEEAL